MKLLVLALDGGDRRIVEALDMPFLQSLMERSACLEVEEDLWSRGWGAVLGGAHGRTTGGFYNKPKLDGSYEFTSSFGGDDYRANPHVTPIWEKVCARGHRIGFMGVNTTMPPPQDIEGFFLAGPGGGYPLTLEPPEEACYPRTIQDALREAGYIWEVRFNKAGVRDTEAFFDLLKREAQARVQPFLQLCDEYGVDLGVFHHKTPVVVQNLMMSEIEQLINSDGTPSNEMQHHIVGLYRVLDDTLATVYEQLQPAHHMVVSDHGSSSYRTQVNVNSFLKEKGFQQLSGRSIASRVKSHLKRLARAVLPSRQRSQIARSLPKTVTTRTTSIDWSRTKAFGARYVPGVYLNDERFGEPTVSEEEKETLTQQIVDAFNVNEEAREGELSARPYREFYQDAPKADLLPDIWIDSPDTAFFRDRGPFIRPNPKYGLISSLKDIPGDLHTGFKRRHPLLCVDESIASHVKRDDDQDLTLAYRIMDRTMTS